MLLILRLLCQSQILGVFHRRRSTSFRHLFLVGLRAVDFRCGDVMMRFVRMTCGVVASYRQSGALLLLMLLPVLVLSEQKDASNDDQVSRLYNAGLSFRY